MNILISACLLGIPCRYNGLEASCPQLSLLIGQHTLIPVCPEQLGGLPTPRPPAEIRNNRVITKNGTDITIPFCKGAELTLFIAKQLSCTHAILKQNSPSCGNRYIYDGKFNGTKVNGEGLTAKVLRENGIITFDEQSFQNFFT